MSTETNTRIVYVAALGLLLLLFGIVLVVVLTSKLITHTDFVFSISRRAFNVGLLAVLVLFVAGLFFFARGLGRRRQN